MPNPDKNREQHFLIDEDILDLEIKTADINEKDKIIEIGAGDGKLTKELVKKTKQVLAFETDLRFENNLKKIQASFKNLRVMYSNALDFSWKEYNKIVSNIPYSLSGAIIEKAISEEIQELTLIVGEKFKMILESQDKIGLITNLFFDVKFVKKVDKKCFYPIPKVNSWLVKLVRKKSKVEKIEEKLLKDILLSNKTIKNAIIFSFVKNGFTKNKARTFIEKNKFNEFSINKRVASITGKFIVKLSKSFKELNQII